MKKEDFELKLEQINEQSDESKRQGYQSGVGDLVLEYFPYKEKDNTDKMKVIISNMKVILRNSYQYDILKLFNSVQTIKNPLIRKSIIDNLEQLTIKEYNPNIFKYLFNHCDENELINVIDYNKILSGPYTENYIQLFNSIFFNNQFLNSQKFFDVVFTKKLNYISLYNLLDSLNESEYYIKRYNTYIINYIQENTKDLLKLKELLEYIFVKEHEMIINLIELINQKIDAEPLGCFKDYLLSLTFNKISNGKTIEFNQNDPDFQAFCEIAARVIIQNAQNENVKFSQIKIDYDTEYHKRVIFEINNKFVKITNIYQTFNTIKTPEILASLMRKEFDIQGHKLYIDVTQRVDTNDISEEEVYQLYKKIRSYGLIWTDAHKGNVGRLLKDNIIHFDGNLNPPYQSLGYIEEISSEVILKKGDLVILDTDYIFKEDDPNIEFGCHKSREYEERYQNELTSVKKM